MTQTQDSNSTVLSTQAFTKRKLWVFIELAVCYGLILFALWTPRPLQRWFYWSAILWVVVTTCISFAGWRAMGFRIAGFWRSLWLVGAALSLAAAAVILAARLHTLHAPGSFAQWIGTFLGYAIWSFVQQFLMQGYFLLRILQLVPNPKWAAATTALIFALAHLPNPILTPLTLFWGLAACLVFLRHRNLYPLAIAHAIFGICIAITIPGPVVRNMRVGLGYLTYHQHGHHHFSQSPHTASTIA